MDLILFLLAVTLDLLFGLKSLMTTDLDPSCKEKRVQFYIMLSAYQSFDLSLYPGYATLTICLCSSVGNNRSTKKAGFRLPFFSPNRVH